MTRRKAREEAFFLIFEFSFSGESVDDMIANAVEGRELEIDPFAYSLAKNTIDQVQKIDLIVEQYATKWKKNRISKVSLALLRLALYEMWYEDSIPGSGGIGQKIRRGRRFLVCQRSGGCCFACGKNGTGYIG